MEFADVTSFFNNDPVYDAYTGEFLFYCHSKAHNDQSSAGATIRRRTMTTEVDAAAPARGVVNLLGDPWLVGVSNVDAFQGEAVRRVWGLKRGINSMALLTPAQACAGAPGLQLYAQKELYKDMVNRQSFSDWDPLWSVNVAPNEAADSRGMFLREGTTLHRIRSLYMEVDGLRVLEADEFESDALQTATFTTSATLNLVTDKLETTSVTLPVIQTDSMKFYRYRTQVEADTQPGDRVVFVSAASAAPQPGSQFTMMGATWRVLTSIVEHDARVLRARLV
jgi:hypothetical protein